MTAPGDGEVTVVGDDSMDEKDPLLARLLAAAAAGAPPAGPANKRKPVRIVLDPDDRPVTKGTLCSQAHGFNLHAATRVAANDKPGREALCRYILRPPLANDRLHILPDGTLRLDRHCDGNPGRVSFALGTYHPPCHPLAALGLAKPSRALAPPGKARLRQRDRPGVDPNGLPFHILQRCGAVRKAPPTPRRRRAWLGPK